MLEWMHDESVVGKLKGNFIEKTLADAESFILASANKEENIHLAIVSDEDEYMAIQNEMSSMYPDIEPQKKSSKVFGRDIFNNKSLTFEPNMNIATPQNYRLGPGDAVIIDIYGASQKTIQDTV